MTPLTGPRSHHRQQRAPVLSQVRPAGPTNSVNTATKRYAATQAPRASTTGAFGGMHFWHTAFFAPGTLPKGAVTRAGGEGGMLPIARQHAGHGLRSLPPRCCPSSVPRMRSALVRVAVCPSRELRGDGPRRDPVRGDGGVVSLLPGLRAGEGLQPGSAPRRALLPDADRELLGPEWDDGQLLRAFSNVTGPWLCAGAVRV